MKNIPVWYEKKRPRNGTSRLQRSMDRAGSLAEEVLVLNSNSQNTRTAVEFSQVLNMAASKEDFSSVDSRYSRSIIDVT